MASCKCGLNILQEKPLIAGIHVTDMLDTKHWIKVKYERLGEFCYNCGRITHPTKKCDKLRRKIVNEEHESVLSCGPWLRAKERSTRFLPRLTSVKPHQPCSTETKNAPAPTKTVPADANQPTEAPPGATTPSDQTSAAIQGGRKRKRRVVCWAQRRGTP
ncbi:hypothetical protein Tsubulata_016354 [Turnera subulata]|uniref:Zinc knuckle CX2CX4HX4C domain-containing protein n=1 Tax=Turnera subulata TaxID=218843 RepID=A0A9Q0F443_9ROSI|nr:hypothetical protein Tsubulata_016354 [Turnera subulata]